MSDAAVIETRALTKMFGPRPAVNSIDLTVARGTCFGFLGPNGAGKTTMIRMLLGLARPSSGEARVRGFSIGEQTREALAGVGGIVEEPAFYPYMTGQQNLEAWASLLDSGAEARIPQLLERVRLTGRENEKVGRYSLGMRQRLALARALLGDPELLILDEPTNGLDPAGMAEFRMLVRDMVEREGRTVFISSHLLDEVEKMCDSVAIINNGVVVNEGTVDSLLAGGDVGIEVDVDDPQRATAVLIEIPGVQNVSVAPSGRLLVPLQPSRELAIEINRRLVEAGIGVAALVESRATLEQRYLAITGPPAPIGYQHPQQQPPVQPTPGAPPPPPPPEAGPQQ